MYGRTMEEIYISGEQLVTARKTIDTLIHELAHHTSGAEDLEEAHSAAMTNVAARVVQLATAKSFDEELEEAEW